MMRNTPINAEDIRRKAASHFSLTPPETITANAPIISWNKAAKPATIKKFELKMSEFRRVRASPNLMRFEYYQMILFP